MPTRRGYRSGHGAAARTTWHPSRTPTGSSPRSPSPAGSHRERSSPRSSSGGSLTTSRPPTTRNPAAHSAVTAGLPKLRAVTRSKRPRRSVPCANSSARPRSTVTRSPTPSVSTASTRKSVRRSLASRSHHSVAGQAATSTSPGSPPPLPRSRARRGSSPAASSVAASAKRRACSMWGSIGPGPRNPSSRDRSKTRTSGSSAGDAADEIRSSGPSGCRVISPRGGSRRGAAGPHPQRRSTRRRCR